MANINLDATISKVLTRDDSKFVGKRYDDISEEEKAELYALYLQRRKQGPKVTIYQGAYTLKELQNLVRFLEGAKMNDNYTLERADIGALLWNGFEFIAL